MDLHDALPISNVVAVIYCAGLRIDKNIIFRVSNEEKDDNLDEEYFMAIIEEKAMKLEDDGVYSAVSFRKNDWIVYVCWCIFNSNKMNESGDRFYSKGFGQWIPCGSIIRTITLSVTLKWLGKYNRLGGVLNCHIGDHDDICY